MSSSSSRKSSPNRSGTKNTKKNNVFQVLSKKKSNQLLSLDRSMSYNQKNPNSLLQKSIIQSPSNKKSSIINDGTSLQEQNKKLRRKLKQLSQRLDEELQRAAENKLKMQSIAKLNHPIKQQTTNLQLQNAYKMIQRLQKSVKDFQNKQSYQISVKRIMDLESIIKKKQSQNQDLKDQIKTNKKTIREKQKHINELLENSKKGTNVTQDKQLIQRIKKKLKKVTEENQQLRKKELLKHEQLVKAERKIVQMEQDEQLPIGREQILLKQLEEYKKKYKQTMQRVQKQNVYITRLNERIDKDGSSQNKERKSQSDKDRRNASKSLEQLPALNPNKMKTGLGLLEHLPSPKVAVKLKRY